MPTSERNPPTTDPTVCITVDVAAAAAEVASLHSAILLSSAAAPAASPQMKNTREMGCGKNNDNMSRVWKLPVA